MKDYRVVLFGGRQDDEGMKFLMHSDPIMNNVESLITYVQEIANDYAYDTYTFRVTIDGNTTDMGDIEYNRSTKTFSHTVVDASAMLINFKNMFQVVEMTKDETITYIEKHSK